MMRLLSISGISLLLLCAGCGGGGGDSDSGGGSGVSNPPTPVPTNPGGIWYGTSSGGGTTIAIEGIITEELEGRFIDENGTQYVITTVTGDDGNISINFNAYAQFGYVFLDGSTSGTGSITGTVNERSSFSGNFSFSTGESGSVSFSYDSLYDRDSSLAKLEGQWQEDYGVMNVDPDGSFFEQDQFGCIYEGQASIINSSYNAYGLSMTVSNCGSSNGNYTGLGVLADLSVENDEDLLIVQMNSNALIFTTALERL
jgi:hypothetical protein